VEKKGPDHASLIAFAYGREPWATWLKTGGCLESAHSELTDLITDVLARWGHPTPPVPEVREVGLLVDRLNQVAGDFDFLCNKIVNGECRTLACLRRGGYDNELCRAKGIKPPDPLVATCPALEKAGAMRRAATLLQQLSAPAPAAVGEVMELGTLLRVGGSCGGGARLSQDQCARTSALLQQQESRIANLRSALADCGRAVGAVIGEDCTDAFLLEVPAKVRLAVAKPAPAVAPGGPSDEAWKEFIQQVGLAQQVATREGQAPRFDLVQMALALWRESSPAPAAVPVAEDLQHLVRFMCKMWVAIDEWASMWNEAMETYPMIQGTRNQMNLREIAAQPYDKKRVAMVPLVYDAGDGILIHRTSQTPGAWAVRRDIDCLALDGTWSYEPMPSSRTEEWLALHRFASAEAAASAIPLPQAGEVQS
jgi:hypothetical protein